MLFRSSIGESTLAAAAPRCCRSRSLLQLRFLPRAHRPLTRSKLAPVISAMGANDNKEEEEEEGKGVVDQAGAPAPASAAAAPSPSKPGGEDPSAMLDSLASFKGFVVEEVLNVNDMNKVAAVVGSFPGAPGRAVVRLSRHPFDAASLAAPGGSNEDEEQEENDDDDDGGGGGGKERASKKVKTQTCGLLGAKLRLAKTMRNDIYGKYSGDFLPSPSLLEAAGAGLVVDVTYPATEKHIAKQRAQRRVMLLETSELFEKVTSPLVEAIPPNRVAWVENILEGKAEVDRVMARNERNGWVLLPDMKWDHRKADAAIAELKKLEGEREKGDEGEGGDSRAALAAASDREKAAKESFYAQLIFRDKGLKSLRDIDGESAPRVAAAVAAAFDFIKTHYGIPRSSLRAFFHYHPSYWRLHVHFCGPQVFPDDSAGRAHLVEDVLEAVRAQPRWWRERALSVRSFRGDDLAEALIAAGGEQ